MRTLIATTLVITVITAKLSSNGDLTSNQEKAYLSDTSGNLLDSAPCDAFGNVNFHINKGGIYQIQLRKGTTVKWNKRALLNPGFASLQVPNSDVSREREINALYSIRRSSSIDKGELFEAAADYPVSAEYDMMAAPSKVTESVGSSVRSTAHRKETLEKKPPKSIPGVKEVKEKKVEKIKAGTLTAGLWNDLENWERFRKTLKDQKDHLGVWDWNLLDRRFSIEIIDKNGKPAIDVALQLRNASNESVFWNAKTDNQGFAEMWYAPFLKSAPSVDGGFFLYAKYGELGWTKLGKVSANGESKNTFRINYSREIPKAVDIAFIVDATGSMGDEINYLKEELMELMIRSSQFAPCSDVRLASVFYRDITDSYVSIHAPFTTRYEDALVFIQEQHAGGGGDFPEAVDAGLEESINKLKWSNHALARICFLVLDAPPHSEKRSQIEALCNQYAQQGIKIIPVVASGIDKPTEFLMKQLAALTSGDYIYITDDSGVGESHLKPSGVENNVDLLINQMEKVIRKYTKTDDCVQEPKPYEPEPKTLIFGDQQILIQSFPNPAYSFINIHSNIAIKSIEVVNISGQRIKSIDTVNEDRYRLDVRDIPKGMYILAINTQSGRYTAKILILDSQRQD